MPPPMHCQSWLEQLGPRLQTFWSGPSLFQSWFLHPGPFLQTTLKGALLSLVNELRSSWETRYSLVILRSLCTDEGLACLDLFLYFCIFTIKLCLLCGLRGYCPRQCIEVHESQLASSRFALLFYIILDILTSAAFFTIVPCISLRFGRFG